MNPETMALINKALAMPNTHKVTLQYSYGKIHTFETRCIDSANNYANGHKRNIGKKHKNPETNTFYWLESVTITKI